MSTLWRSESGETTLILQGLQGITFMLGQMEYSFGKSSKTTTTMLLCWMWGEGYSY